jgi:hypothetical protein
MSEKIDYLIQDCDALLKAIDENREAMDAKGFSEARYTALTSANGDLIQKEAAQQRAVKLVNEKTVEQNDAMESVSEIIQQIRNAVKSAYGKDDAKLNLFKVGDRVPATVKALRSLTEYMMQLTLEYHDVLLENGLLQEDIDGLNSSYGLLVSTDAVQENAKKLQKTATVVRNDAAKKLKDLMFKTRNFAKTCFAKSPEILLQFKPLPKGRAGGNGKETVEEEQAVS